MAQHELCLNTYNLQILRKLMLAQKSVRSESTYESRYNCVICLERVKYPISCARCKTLICQAHLNKIHNRCPYCRLTPFEYVEDRFLQELIKNDKKKEEEFLISTKVFKCLVEGCTFEGKYHKMDLHRRRQHRNQDLKEIIFPEDRENGKKRRAMQALVKRLQQKEQKTRKAYHISLLLHAKVAKKAELQKLYAMALHVELCDYKDCQRVFAEQTMCFIGNNKKQLSDCPQSQKFLTFY